MKAACLNIPTKNSGYATWKQWHVSLKKCVGKANANQLWLLNYDKEQPDDNVELRSYMRTQGVDLDRDVAQRLTDWGSGVYNWVGGAVDFTSYTAMAIVIIIVGGAGLLIYNIAKTADSKVAMDAAKLYATRGMSGALEGGGMERGLPGGPPPGLTGGGQDVLIGGSPKLLGE